MVNSDTVSYGGTFEKGQLDYYYNERHCLAITKDYIKTKSHRILLKQRKKILTPHLTPLRC